MNDLLVIILKNIGSFAITMFSVEITIFTVIYSFIVSKRSYFRAINQEAKKQKFTSSYLHSEIKFAVEYMNKLKKLNLFVLILAAISLILYGWSFFIPEIPQSNNELSLYHYIFGSISLIYIIATLILLIVYVYKYFDEVKL